ncbi:MAG TPA: electron transfer flavoprotein subunit alpha/FixB family protein [bacterium]|nr:electron transfer flavoprotein subunit alpha/FixB family protein [bacterium]
MLVLGTLADGSLSRSSLELVGAARALDAAFSAGVAAALLGHGQGLAGAVETLHQHGVGTVYRVDDPALDVGQADAFLAAAEQVVQKARPDIVLVTADTVGREVAPRLAHRLGAGLVSECVEIAAEGSDVVARRQAYGGRAMATYVVRRRPAVLSVKPRVLDVPQPSPVKGNVEDVPVTIDLAKLPTRVREVLREKSEVSLEDAQIVIGGGRGLGGPDGFAAIGALAEALGGAVGSSRPPADAGWVPISWQIGQTGKTIRPALYIAVGISGATQHVAGMAGSRTIVAINRDPEAPIFGVAHLGIVGDYREVLPPLIAKIKQLKGR